MSYETSYTSGGRPFLPNPKRGYWLQPSDFVFVTLSLAFKTDYVVQFIPIQRNKTPLIALLLFVGCVAVFVVPLMVLQSYLGQFSSSGFISAFRIAPAFKGIGYIALVLNVAVLMFSSLNASVPLFFLVNSLRPELPWSCEYFQASHLSNVTNNICNNSNGTQDFYVTRTPSFIFFSSQFGSNYFHEDRQAHISWTLVACSLLVWVLIAVIAWRVSTAEKLGRLMRYAVCGTYALLLICFVRLSLLPGAGSAIVEFLATRLNMDVLLFSLLSLSTFGLGWGSTLTLASFNRFRENLVRSNWVICAGFLLIQMTIFMTDAMLTNHMKNIVGDDFLVDRTMQFFLSSASVLATLDWPRFWTLLYYGTLLMCAIMVLVTHLHVILTSLFDEFEVLRTKRLPVTFGLIGVVALLSIYMNTPEVLRRFYSILAYTLFNTAGLNLLLLLVVLWVYGRVRFHRDIEFMLGSPFPNWMVYMVRFVTPVYLLLLLINGLVATFVLHFYVSVGLMIILLIFIVTPWLVVPGYCILAMLQSTGPTKLRFRRVCRPTDWYPVDPEHRQRYEELVNNSDMTQQLSIVDAS